MKTESSEIGGGLEWIVRKQITYRKHVLIRIRVQSNLVAGERRDGKVSDWNL